MRRLPIEPRPDWQGRLTALGMDLEQAPASPYWREDAAYTFSGTEIETLHGAMETLVELVDVAVDTVVAGNRFAELGIPPRLAEVAAESWRRDEPSLYGRFDLRFDGHGPPKLLEYNADTPTALFEASVVQWHWLSERFPGQDQYNSIHERLIDCWAEWRRSGRLARVHFACMPEDDDDLLTTAYLQDTAIQGGLATQLLDLPDVGWDGTAFVDLANARIDALFKLYPWDWLVTEPFFPHIAPSDLRMIEPAWRVIPASKGILPILWELFPGHPNLLPASLDPQGLPSPYLTKPLFGREGANITITSEHRPVSPTDGPYADMSTISQAFVPLPDFDGWHPVVGGWIVAGEPSGIGIREDRSLVTAKGARFVPHLIDD